MYRRDLAAGSVLRRHVHAKGGEVGQGGAKPSGLQPAATVLTAVLPEMPADLLLTARSGLRRIGVRTSRTVRLQALYSMLEQKPSSGPKQ